MIFSLRIFNSIKKENQNKKFSVDIPNKTEGQLNSTTDHSVNTRYGDGILRQYLLVAKRSIFFQFMPKFKENTSENFMPVSVCCTSPNC